MAGLEMLVLAAAAEARTTAHARVLGENKPDCRVCAPDPLDIHAREVGTEHPWKLRNH